VNVSYRSDVSLTEEPTEPATAEQAEVPVQVPEMTTAKQLFLPLKVLISPLKTFSFLAQRPSTKGLISLSALILVLTASTLYAFASRVVVNINEQRTSFLVLGSFNNWYTSYIASTVFGIVLYWLVFATGIILISRLLGGKNVSLRILFTSLAYLLSVFVFLYAVRTVIYLTLPSLYFKDLSNWPPMNETERNSAISVIEKGWGTLPSEIELVLSFAALVWLAVLGAVAVKTLREVNWSKAVLVSLSVIAFTFLLFRLP